MKVNQNAENIARKDLPGMELLGMTLLAILQHGAGKLMKEATEADVTAYLGRKRYEHERFLDIAMAIRIRL